MLLPTLLLATQVLTVPPLGSWLDRTERLSAVRATLFVGNACVTVTCVCLALLTGEAAREGTLEPSVKTVLLFGGVLVFSCVAEAMSQAQSLAISRDWVIQICESDSELLASLNASLQQIDLSAAVLSPLLLGLLLNAVRPEARVLVGAAVIGGFNVCSLPLELLLTQRAYAVFAPVLAAKAHRHSDGTVHAHIHGARPHLHAMLHAPPDQAHAHAHESGGAHAHAHGDRAHAHDEQAGADIVLFEKHLEHVPGGDGGAAGGGCSARWVQYAAHPVFGASVGFCLLFLTVLDNSTLVTAYLQFRGLDPALLGLARTADAAVGLLGTLAYPHLARALGSVEAAALFSVWAFWLSLAPAGVALAAVGQTRAADEWLLACMVGARASLWSFDLAHTQAMQQRVHETERGAINACQASLSQALSVLVQLGALGWHRPAQFGLLLYASLVAVLAAALVYSAWYYTTVCTAVARCAAPPAAARQPLLPAADR
mmetsp:Transcript_30799/g.71744  ORF Transcript_30799/g.71744 Transcript_30799/m.71744 type:complete len:486 (-) Transcript_30799:245-1702(-)